MRKFVKYVLVIITGVTIVSCNRDDIIEKDDNGITGDFLRPVVDGSKAGCVKVYEYTPAPGQFINEGMTTDEGATASAAAEWAMSRLDRGLYVSLGGFGGYIVVGFDHSIVSSGDGYDFGVAGNAFFNAATGTGGSNEPGVVYVMQDTNGNGLPDDVWYRLRGSNDDEAGTRHDYKVTYKRPSGPGMDVEWSDNAGNNGVVAYLGMFHKQDSYYPAWVDTDEYTLTGTCIGTKTSQDANGIWNNGALEWGYADNMGTDTHAVGKYSQCNRFRISDAVNAAGQPADLEYIDFVKVQTAMNGSAGILGEISTEVLGVIDLNVI